MHGQKNIKGNTCLLMLNANDFEVRLKGFD